MCFMVWRPVIGPRFGLEPNCAAEPLELPRGHIPALDAIRGLAIVIVTLYRFGGGGEGAARCVEHNWLIELGSRGVDLFFVLSGFLITGILYDVKGKEHYFRNFYMRRALRIFPLYYGAIAAVVFAIPLLSTVWAAEFQPAVENQAWLWLYGANVLQAIRGAWNLGPLNHFWSLAIEEHFYLVWPAVIYFTSRRSALRICGLLFVASVFARAAWLAAGGNDVAAIVLTPLRMDGLVLGSWIALACRGDGGLAWLRWWAQPTLLFCGLAAVVADALGRRLFGLPTAAWAVTCGAFLVLMLVSRGRSPLNSLGTSKTLQFFGKYSYAMYVFQLPLIYLAAPVATASGIATLCGSQVAGQAVYCLVMFTATTLLAIASWNLFEKRILSLKHRFEQRS
jgi:peptidoglycan/LPS O-acetylase OafA/YrhL